MMDSSAPLGGGARDVYLAQARGLSRRWFWLTIFAVILLAGYFLLSRLGGASGTSSRASTPRPAVPVTAAEVKRGDLNRYLTAIGTVTAFNTVTVRTRVDGQIVNVAFKEGQTVHQGDLLIEVDPHPYQAALAQAEGQLAKDRAALANAKITLARDRSLYQQGVIAAQDFDNQQSLVGQSDGAVQSDAANVAAAKVQLAYTKITSPITGRIGLRMVDLGNIVHAADAGGLAVITQLQPIAIDFSIPEDNLQQVIKDMGDGQQLPVSAFDRELKNQLAIGTLETFDSQIDQTTGTIKLKAIFPNDDNALFPNQFVNVKLLVATMRDTLLAPVSALQRNPQGTFVYVVKPDKTVDVRTVSVGATQGDVVALDSGVTAGELLVTDGLDRLQAGTRVIVQPPAASAAATPSAAKATVPRSQ